MRNLSRWSRICAALLISLMLAPVVLGATVEIKWKEDWRNVRIGDKTRSTDVGPQMRDGIYYFPLRFIAEYMGHIVYWLDYEKSAVVRGQGRNIQIWLDRDAYQSKGETKTFDYKPFILRSRTLVSEAFIQNELGLATSEIPPDDRGYHLQMEIDEDDLKPFAPDFTLKTQSGGEVTFSEELARDDVKCILINFWSTRCLPCNKELPALVELYNKFKDDGLQVLGVCTDSTFLDEERTELIDRLGIEYPVLLDPMAETYYSWGGLGVPNMSLVNKDSLIVWQHDGYSPDTPVKAESKIRELLGLD